MGYTTLQAYGAVTGPGAGAVIATLNAIPAGYYVLLIEYRLDGTVADPADRDNMQVMYGATPVKRLLTTGGVSASPVPDVTCYISANGATQVTVQAVGAATSTAVYSCSLTATQIG